MAGIPINGTLDVTWPSLLDRRSGKLSGSTTVPYESTAEALDATTGVRLSRRAEGLVLFIRNDTDADVIDHWQFMGGVADENLVKLNFAGAPVPPYYVSYVVDGSTTDMPGLSTTGADTSIMTVPYYTPFTGWRLASSLKITLAGRMIVVANGTYTFRLVTATSTQLFTTGTIAVAPGTYPYEFEITWQPNGGYLQIKITVNGVLVAHFFDIGQTITTSFKLRGATTTTGGNNSIIPYMISTILAW